MRSSRWFLFCRSAPLCQALPGRFGTLIEPLAAWLPIVGWNPFPHGVPSVASPGDGHGQECPRHGCLASDPDHFAETVSSVDRDRPRPNEPLIESTEATESPKAGGNAPSLLCAGSFLCLPWTALFDLFSGSLTLRSEAWQAVVKKSQPK